jgi:hypothetical protein
MKALIALSLVKESREEVEKLVAAIEKLAEDSDGGRTWLLEVKLVEDVVVKQVVADRQTFKYFDQRDVK